MNRFLLTFSYHSLVLPLRFSLETIFSVLCNKMIPKLFKTLVTVSIIWINKRNTNLFGMRKILPIKCHDNAVITVNSFNFVHRAIEVYRRHAEYTHNNVRKGSVLTETQRFLTAILFVKRNLLPSNLFTKNILVTEEANTMSTRRTSSGL